jgi:hypothetical protein
LFRRAGTNHPLHFWLTLATAGAWGIVWLVLLRRAARRHWRCGYCLRRAQAEVDPVAASGGLYAPAVGELRGQGSVLTVAAMPEL